jgi:hypothetical protein
MIESYAQTGCKKVVKGRKVKYSWETNSRSSDFSNVKHTCAYIRINQLIKNN